MQVGFLLADVLIKIKLRSAGGTELIKIKLRS